MKLSLLDRTITCCLLGAATIAVASGMNKVDGPSDDDTVTTVAADADDANLDDEIPVDENPPEDGDAADEPTEKSLGELVEAVAGASAEEKEEKRNKLKEALSKTFQNRTAIQRDRIASIRERLEAIEVQLEKRSNLEEQIVERRLNELLGEKDELSWDHEPSIDIEPKLGDLGLRNSMDMDRNRMGFEFPKEFPREFLGEYSADMAKFLERDKLNALQAKKNAELAMRNAEISRKNAEQGKKNAEQFRKQASEAAGRARESQLKRLAPFETKLDSMSDDRLRAERSTVLDDQSKARTEAMQRQIEKLQEAISKLKEAND